MDKLKSIHENLPLIGGFQNFNIWDDVCIPLIKSFKNGTIQVFLTPMVKELKNF